MERLEEIIAQIHRAADTISDELERLVLEALLDGERNKFIANQIGISRQWYYEIKRAVTIKMAWQMYGQGEGQPI